MPKPSPNTEVAQVNILSKDTVLEGVVTAEYDIRVSGTVTGTLRGSSRVIVTPEANVEGDLHAAEAIIGGRVKGEIHATNRLTLKGSACIEGSVTTARLIVEEGASFNGECCMNNATKKPGGDSLKITTAAPKPQPKVQARGGQGVSKKGKR